MTTPPYPTPGPPPSAEAKHMAPLDSTEQALHSLTAETPTDEIIACLHQTHQDLHTLLNDSSE